MANKKLLNRLTSLAELKKAREALVASYTKSIDDLNSQIKTVAADLDKSIKKLDSETRALAAEQVFGTYVGEGQQAIVYEGVTWDSIKLEELAKDYPAILDARSSKTVVQIKACSGG